MYLRCGGVASTSQPVERISAFYHVDRKSGADHPMCDNKSEPTLAPLARFHTRIARSIIGKALQKVRRSAAVNGKAFKSFPGIG
jgi:hypothetical protein